MGLLALSMACGFLLFARWQEKKQKQTETKKQTETNRKKQKKILNSNKIKIKSRREGWWVESVEAARDELLEPRCTHQLCQTFTD